MHRAAREPAARQNTVDRRNAKRQHAMMQRLLNLPDPLPQRVEVARTRHALRKARPHHMRKAHPLTCNYR